MLGPAISLAIVGTLAHRGDRRLRGGAGCSTSTLLEGLLLGAILSSTDGAAIFAVLRGSTLRRRAGAHARGRVGLQRPGRRPARARLHRVDRGARLRPRPTCALLFVQELGIGAASSASRRLARGAGLPARAARDRRPVPGRLAGDGGAGLRAAPTSCTARASSRSTSPASCSAARRSRPSGRSPPSTTGWPGSRSSAMFLTLGLLVFPSELGDVALEGTVLALVARGRRAADRGVAVATLVRALHVARAARARLGRAARRGAGRARDVPGDRGRPGQPASSSTSCSSPCCSRRCCRARRSSRSPARLGVTTNEPALPAPARRGRHDPPAGRGDARVPGRRRTTRSPARACATSGCRATRWST